MLLRYCCCWLLVCKSRSRQRFLMFCRLFHGWNLFGWALLVLCCGCCFFAVEGFSDSWLLGWCVRLLLSVRLLFAARLLLCVVWLGVFLCIFLYMGNIERRRQKYIGRLVGQQYPRRAEHPRQGHPPQAFLVGRVGAGPCQITNERPSATISCQPLQVYHWSSSCNPCAFSLLRYLSIYVPGNDDVTAQRQSNRPRTACGITKKHNTQNI